MFQLLVIIFMIYINITKIHRGLVCEAKRFYSFQTGWIQMSTYNSLSSKAFCDFPVLWFVYMFTFSLFTISMVKNRGKRAVPFGYGSADMITNYLFHSVHGFVLFVKPKLNISAFQVYNSDTFEPYL